MNGAELEGEAAMAQCLDEMRGAFRQAQAWSHAEIRTLPDGTEAVRVELRFQDDRVPLAYHWTPQNAPAEVEAIRDGDIRDAFEKCCERLRLRCGVAPRAVGCPDREGRRVERIDTGELITVYRDVIVRYEKRAATRNTPAETLRFYEVVEREWSWQR